MTNIDPMDVFEVLAKDETTVSHVSMGSVQGTQTHLRGIEQLGVEILNNHSFNKVNDEEFQKHMENYRKYEKILLDYISSKTDEEIQNEIKRMKE